MAKDEKDKIATTPTPTAPVENAGNDSVVKDENKDVPHTDSGVSTATDGKTPERLSDRSLTTAEVNDARAVIEQERFNDRLEEFNSADPVDRAVQGPDGRAFDKDSIRESFENDQFVRVAGGNVLYPAPLERPVGASPSFVGEILEFIQETDQAQREDNDKRQGLDPNDRSDRDLLERARSR